MSDIEQPDKLPRWASQDVPSPTTGVLNVVEPPESKKNVGWNSFEQPARNFENWLNRTVYRWLQFFKDRVVDRQPVANGSSSITIEKENVLVTIYAIDKTNPANYLHAVGYRVDNTVDLNTLANNQLQIDTLASDGTVTISGANAADLIIYANIQK